MKPLDWLAFFCLDNALVGHRVRTWAKNRVIAHWFNKPSEAGWE